MDRTKAAITLLQNVDIGFRDALTFFSGEAKGLFAVLNAVVKHENGVSPGEVTAELCMTTPRTAAVLKSLEERGYIQSCTSSDDARKKVIKATEEGIAACARQRKKIIDYVMLLLGKLTDEEAEQFAGLFAKLFS